MTKSDRKRIERWASKMKPRLRAEGEGQTEAPLLRVSAGLWILFNWGLRPSNRNSVLALLKQRKFDTDISKFSIFPPAIRYDTIYKNLYGYRIDIFDISKQH